MQETEKMPSERLKEFLDFIRECHARYELAYDLVNREDRRLQDFAHEIEFATDEELYDVAAEFRESRRERRRNKDEVQLYEHLEKFSGEKGAKDMLNRLEQLLGQQRKREEYLSSERVYKPRVK